MGSKPDVRPDWDDELEMSAIGWKADGQLSACQESRDYKSPRVIATPITIAPTAKMVTCAQ